MKPTYEELEQRIAQLEQMLAIRAPEPGGITDLREKSRVFEAIVSQSPAAIHITNKLGEVIYINNAYFNLLGYSAGEMTDSLMLSILADEESLLKYEELKVFLQQGKVWTGEMRMARKDKRIIWVRISIFPLVRQGEITNIVAIINDITDIKTIEAEKHEHEAIYKTLIENIPIAISIIDEDGKIDYFNPSTAKLFNIDGAKTKDLTFHDLYPPEFATDLVNKYHQVFKTGQQINVKREIEWKGRNINLNITRLPLINESGQVTKVLSIMQDITEQSRREQLQNIQHRIDSLSNFSTNLHSSLKRTFQNLLRIDWIDVGGIYLFDEDQKDLRLVFSTGLSKAFTKLVTTYTFKDAQAKIVLRGKPLYAGRENFFNPIRKILVEEGFTLIVAIPLIHKKKVIGSLNLGSKNAIQVSQQDRLFVESVASRLANLIMLVNTQVKLDKSNSELNTKLQELSINQQLLIQKSRLESLGELSAGLAHEINQPLTVISLVMENLNQRIEMQKASSEYIAAKFSTINQNINKIKKLIEHVRLFSRDQGNISFEQVEVNQVILNALSMIESQLINNQIKVNTDLSENVGYTIGNPARFEQVILNLISNARDALEEKGRKSMSGHTSMEIRISTSGVKNRAIVRVWDNGTGILSTNIDKIFNPFFTTKAEGKGTGLGLPIVYGIISEMKGEISVRTEEGEFTEISINLPHYKKR